MIEFIGYCVCATLAVVLAAMWVSAWVEQRRAVADVRRRRLRRHAARCQVTIAELVAELQKQLECGDVEYVQVVHLDRVETVWVNQEDPPQLRLIR
jgi:hypothetical protein